MHELTSCWRFSDLRPIYISVVIFNADGAIGVGDTSLAHCWIWAHCQRAPVALRLSRSAPILTTNVGGAQDTSMHEAYIALALFRPTPDSGCLQTERFAYGIQITEKAARVGIGGSFCIIV